MLLVGQQSHTRLQNTVVAHKTPIKSLVAVPETGRIFTTAMDSSVTLWKVNGSSVEPEFHFPGHERNVLCSDRNYDASRFCTGGWDKTVKVWLAKKTIDPEKKRRKTEVPSQEPILSLEGHAQAVTGVSWFTPDQICSSSDDKTLKIWDLETQTIKTTLHAAKVPLSLDYCKENGLFLTGTVIR